jgi:hypothetical protein
MPFNTFFHALSSVCAAFLPHGGFIGAATEHHMDHRTTTDERMARTDEKPGYM